MKRAAGFFLVIALAAGAFAGDLVVRLRADGNYVSWAAAPVIDVRSISNPGEQEKFLLLDEMGGKLMHGDIIYLMIPKDLSYLDVDYGSAPFRVRAADRQAGKWEVFRIERADGASAEIGNNDRIVLRNFAGFSSKQLSDLIAERKTTFIRRAGSSLVGDRGRSEASTFRLEVVEPLSRKQPMKLSAPFAVPGLFYVTNYTDREYGKGDSNSDCLDFKGKFQCYDGHSGIDFQTRGPGFRQMDLGGLHVLAAAPGIVVSVDDTNEDRCSGSSVGSVTCPGTSSIRNNVIAVLQDDGNVAQYVHIKRGSAVVQKDQRVKCGDTLAYVGSAGFSTDPHLHFEIWQPRFPGDSKFDNTFFSRARVLDPYQLGLFPLVNGMPDVTCGDQTEKALGSQRIATQAVFQGGAEFDLCIAFAGCGVGLYCGSNRRCTPVRQSGQKCDGVNPCAFGLACKKGTCTLPLP